MASAPETGLRAPDGTAGSGASAGLPPLRIAFDHQAFAAQQHGGVSRYVVRLAGALAAAGHAVQVAAPLHINAYLADLPAGIVRGRRIENARWRRPLMRLANDIIGPRLIAGFAPDIVHESWHGSRGVAPPGARRVTTVHDMIHEKFPQYFAADDPTAARKAAAIARADHVICVSDSTRRDLVARYPDVAGRCSVIHHGFDVPPPSPAAAITAGRPYLLFVGMRGGYKNFAGLVSAFAASPALRADFDVVAVGGGAFSATESALIAGHGLAAQVRQQAADDAALQRALAGAAALVYPSLYEGFGIPPLEAMAARTPVVAMRASAVPEVCGAAAAYAEPDDPDSLRRAIEAVVLSPAQAATLVAAGSDRLRQFSWTRCAAETAAVYRALR